MALNERRLYELAVANSGRTLDVDDDDLLPATAELEKIMQSSNDDNTVTDRFSALERIKQMWEDFDLDEYMKLYGGPPTQAELRRSNTGTSVNDGTLPSESPSWRHRVTIPKPFDMTVRDEIMSKRKEEKFETLKREKVEKERAIEAQLEAQRHFRANPVPAHVYLPIYDELARTQEQRRQFVVEHSQQLLRSLQKPFKFTIRNHTSRSLQRCSSATDLNRTAPDPRNTFKARAVPQSVYDTTITEKMREQDLYRKIQARMRAIDMYRSAAAPPSMEARRKAQQELLADTLRKRSSSADRTRSSTVNPRVFERLSHPSTRPPLPTRSRFLPPEPVNYFEDTTPVLAKSRPRSAAESLAAGRQALRGETAPPTKLTTTSELRMSQVQHKLAAEKAKLEEEEALRQKREQRRKEMARILKERSFGLTPRSELEQSDKDRERAREVSQRTKEYQRQLGDIEQKVAERPLLVERVSADAARKQAAQRYREALERVGLTEDEVLHSTTVAPEFNTSIGRTYDRSAKKRGDNDYYRPDFQASPIAPHSPEDDYAY